MAPQKRRLLEAMRKYVFYYIVAINIANYSYNFTKSAQ